MGPTASTLLGIVKTANEGVSVVIINRETINCGIILYFAKIFPILYIYYITYVLIVQSCVDDFGELVHQFQ